MLVTSSGWTTARRPTPSAAAWATNPSASEAMPASHTGRRAIVQQQRPAAVGRGVEPGPLREHAAEREQQRRAEGQGDLHAGGVCQARAATGEPVRNRLPRAHPRGARQPVAHAISPARTDREYG